MAKKTLEELADNIRVARNDMLAELKKRYPAGKNISFLLSRTQTTPSTGKVVWHDGSGSVGVRLDNAKQNSRRAVRTVDFKYIIG